MLLEIADSEVQSNDDQKLMLLYSPLSDVVPLGVKNGKRVDS